MKARVIASYEAAYPVSFAIRKGEELRFERKPSEWAGWLWCTARSGRSAWIPEAWIAISGGVCVLLRDYNSRELSVEPGDELEVLLLESGWVRARGREGVAGWVPADRLDMDQGKKKEER